MDWRISRWNLAKVKVCKNLILQDCFLGSVPSSSGGGGGLFSRPVIIGSVLLLWMFGLTIALIVVSSKWAHPLLYCKVLFLFLFAGTLIFRLYILLWSYLFSSSQVRRSFHCGALLPLGWGGAAPRRQVKHVILHCRTLLCYISLFSWCWNMDNTGTHSPCRKLEQWLPPTGTAELLLLRCV